MLENDPLPEQVAANLIKRIDSLLASYGHEDYGLLAVCGKGAIKEIRQYSDGEQEILFSFQDTIGVHNGRIGDMRPETIARVTEALGALEREFEEASPPTLLDGDCRLANVRLTLSLNTSESALEDTESDKAYIVENPLEVRILTANDYPAVSPIPYSDVACLAWSPRSNVVLAGYDLSSLPSRLKQITPNISSNELQLYLVGEEDDLQVFQDELEWDELAFSSRVSSNVHLIAHMKSLIVTQLEIDRAGEVWLTYHQLGTPEFMEDTFRVRITDGWNPPQ